MLPKGKAPSMENSCFIGRSVVKIHVGVSQLGG